MCGTKRNIFISAEYGMKSLPALFVALASAAIFMSGTGYSQDKKEGPPPGKGQLPAGWGKLSLQPDQKKQILQVMGSYQAKINDLKDKMDVLKKEEYQEAYKLLSDAQKDTLKKMALEKVDPAKGGGDAKDDKKKGG
jgi:hypothetical protein